MRQKQSEIQDSLEKLKKLQENMKQIQGEEKDLEVATNHDFKDLDILKAQITPFKKYYDL